MEQFGAPQHLIDEVKQDQVIEILPMNWSVVIWFNEVCDLMRYRHDGACLGFDLVQIQTESQMNQREFTKKEFNGLRTMSKAAARTINKVDA
ncbi:DUF1799 domain-containing protein [Colwellia psychrerythraea]|uniref:Uncharacterized protein n=1 Tax=Colwellia psychrerythraea TaxID=28229 RepID=A0A099KNV3_COLPS|nr:DUF1799 domain-containing protein [Colwellia psychrerythraea]KGJ92121.1 hypothetical protein ND2E_3014 [Colwellia psychrerythraea]